MYLLYYIHTYLYQYVLYTYKMDIYLKKKHLKKIQKIKNSNIFFAKDHHHSTGDNIKSKCKKKAKEF